MGWSRTRRLCSFHQLGVPASLLQKQLRKRHHDLEPVYDIWRNELGQPWSIGRLYLLRLRCCHNGRPYIVPRKVLRSQTHRTVHGFVASLLGCDPGEFNKFILREHVGDYDDAGIWKCDQFLRCPTFRLYDSEFDAVHVHGPHQNGRQRYDPAARWDADVEWKRQQDHGKSLLLETSQWTSQR